jgi:hypothetical protein
MSLRNVATVPFALIGGGNSVQLLPPFDLSRAHAVRVEVDLTGVGTADATDTMDLFLQEAADDTSPSWDDRWHCPQFTGAMVASLTAPVERVGQWQAYGAQISVSDTNYIPSGSADSPGHIAQGAVITGPLVGKRRTSLGQQPRHRFRWEVADANNNSAFSGTVNLYVESEV